MKRSERLQGLRTRSDFLGASGVLLITREPPPAPPPAPGQPPIVAGNPAEGREILLSVWDDTTALGLHGHVDLGQGIRTALGQIVAEELDLEMDQVDMVLGDTARAPNQGPTIASASIQIHAVPLRKAAAQARAWLLAQAAVRALTPEEQESLADFKRAEPAHYRRLTALVAEQLLPIQGSAKKNAPEAVAGPSGAV